MSSIWRVGIVRWNSPQADDVRRIREEVFIHEQHVPVAEEWDAIDADAIHVVARDDSGMAAATARLFPDARESTRWRIGRMAVLRAYRCRGVGLAILAFLVEEGKRRGARSFLLSAQTHAIPFYGKAGFLATGPEYDDCGIPHRDMILEVKE